MRLKNYKSYEIDCELFYVNASEIHFGKFTFIDDLTHLSFMSTTTKNLNFLIPPLRNFNFNKSSYQIIVEVKVQGYYRILHEDTVEIESNPILEVCMIPEKINLNSLMG